jgi:hypothetical protein
MNYRLILGIIATVVCAYSFIPYIYGIFFGSIRPQRITWGLWLILNTITFVNQIHNGGGYSSWAIGVATSLLLVIFVLSIFKGMGGASRFDIVVLIMAFILFALWVITKDTRSTTIISITIDCLATSLTIHKTYKHPKSEAHLIYITNSVAAVITLFTISRSDYILYVFPVYLIFANGSISVAKFLGDHREKKTHTSVP